MHSPTTPDDLAGALHQAAAHNRSIELRGNDSKRLMAGPVEAADQVVTTSALRAVRQYEPHDLTISVEAGLSWAELTALLAEHRQMVPLDPPSPATATVGGVIASNCSGPRRRLFGTARDLVIGMTFATVEGKLVDSGGMVVKNVAGLDMAKLMIGSFGTLAAIAVVNFKLVPIPEAERSFLIAFPSLAAATDARNRILSGMLQPAALDLLNPAAGATLGNPAWLLAIRAGGNLAAVDRYERELAGMGEAVAFEGARQQTLWTHIDDFTPWFLGSHPEGAVVRVSCTLKELPAVLETFPEPAVARAGVGVGYGYFSRADDAVSWLAGPGRRACAAVIEYSPDPWKRAAELWPAPGGDLELMRRVKALFDPAHLLNRGRLYRRI